MEEQISCPLGSKCYEIKNNIPTRCAWHIKMKGIDAQGEEHDEWNCAIAWQPIIQLETSQTNRQQTAAVESLRNIVAKPPSVHKVISND